MWGAQIKLWREKWEAGQDVPKEFFEQPEIDPRVEPHWLAFDELGTERAIGMGVGPIPASKIRHYAATELELQGDALEEFCTIIMRADNEYLALVNKPKEANRPSGIPVSDPEGMKRMFDRVEKVQSERKPSARKKL